MSDEALGAGSSGPAGDGPVTGSDVSATNTDDLENRLRARGLCAEVSHAFAQGVVETPSNPWMDASPMASILSCVMEIAGAQQQLSRMETEAAMNVIGMTSDLAKATAKNITEASRIEAARTLAEGVQAIAAGAMTVALGSAVHTSREKAAPVVSGAGESFRGIGASIAQAEMMLRRADADSMRILFENQQSLMSNLALAAEQSSTEASHNLDQMVDSLSSWMEKLKTSQHLG